MKCKEQIEKETGADVLTFAEFEKAVSNGAINCFDGIGFFHDGKKETGTCVWDVLLPWEDIKDYPYVCWYGK